MIVLSVPIFLKTKVSQRLLMERGAETCSIHFLHQLSSKWIIVMSYLWIIVTCHTSNAYLQLLHKMFGENIISQRCTLIWLPRSPDLLPPELFLWGCLKESVYINNLQTLEDLKQNIRQEIDTISQEVLNFYYERSRQKSAISNWCGRSSFEKRYLSHVTSINVTDLSFKVYKYKLSILIFEHFITF